VLANLEAQMRFHREQETHHAEQEVFHQEQRAVHAAEYETVARHYEAFKASASGAAEIAARRAAASPPPPEEPQQPLKPSLPSRLVARAVEEIPEGETFSPSRIADEVNRRYPRELRRPIDSRLASTALRRLLAYGEIRLVEKGTAHREAIYTRS
jgi:ribosomal protein S25